MYSAAIQHEWKCCVHTDDSLGKKKYTVLIHSTPHKYQFLDRTFIYNIFFRFFLKSIKVLFLPFFFGRDEKE